MKKKLLIGVGVVIALFVLGIATLLSMVAYKDKQWAKEQQQARVQAEKAEKARIEADKPTPEKLLAAVNAERAKVGVAPLRMDPLLNQSAQMKADDMKLNNYFDHVDSNGMHGYEYVAKVGRLCLRVGENMTDNIHVNDTSHAVSAWLASAQHRAAMLDQQFNLTGLGVSGTKIVQHSVSLDNTNF